MEELHAAIARKRSEGPFDRGGSKIRKWRRVGDIRAEREAEYWAEERRKKAAEAAKEAARRRALEKELAEREGAGMKRKNEGGNEVEVVLSKEAVIKRLRAAGEPATLFGEDDRARFIRLRQLELEAEGRKVESGKGQRNVFQKKMREMEARDRVDDMYLEEATGAGKHLNGPNGKAGDHSKISSSAASEGADEKSEEKRGESDGDATAAVECGEDLVYQSVKKWLRLWKEDIDAIPAHEKRTNKGRSAAARFEQTKEYLKPLEKLLLTRTLGNNILTALQNIFECVERKEYVLANDFYLRLAIGNAPWPMGATMVGIHARSAREKINEGKIAHVMNDEQTRKYIQAIKRLMTFAQKYAPTVPSKMIRN